MTCHSKYLILSFIFMSIPIDISYSALLRPAVHSQSLVKKIGFSTIICGDVVVAADTAPIRETYPDGRILAVLHKGDKVKLTQLAGDGRGGWLWVERAFGDKIVKGWLDPDQTDFVWEKIKQPTNGQLCPT